MKSCRWGSENNTPNKKVYCRNSRFVNIAGIAWRMKVMGQYENENRRTKCLFTQVHVHKYPAVIRRSNKKSHFCFFHDKKKTNDKKKTQHFFVCVRKRISLRKSINISFDYIIQTIWCFCHYSFNSLTTKWNSLTTKRNSSSFDNKKNGILYESNRKHTMKSIAINRNKTVSIDDIVKRTNQYCNPVYNDNWINKLIVASLLWLWNENCLLLIFPPIIKDYKQALSCLIAYVIIIRCICLCLSLRI